MAKVPRQPDLAHLQSLIPDQARIAAGTLLWRVYFRGGQHPTRWHAFRHVGPLDNRFDHHVGTIGQPGMQARSVLYLAEHPTTCLAEVYQTTRTIDRRYKDPWLVGLQLAQPATLLDLTGTFLTRAGASMGLCTGSRSVARNWAIGFYEAYPALDGLLYPSSMHANQHALVLNDRAERRGVLPGNPRFHRALTDPAMLSLVRNAARTLGYALV